MICDQNSKMCVNDKNIFQNENLCAITHNLSPRGEVGVIHFLVFLYFIFVQIYNFWTVNI